MAGAVFMDTHTQSLTHKHDDTARAHRRVPNVFHHSDTFSHDFTDGFIHTGSLLSSYCKHCTSV